MKYKILGKTGYNVSCVMFGGIIVSNVSAENASEYVSYAIENGVNYFDVAPTYGNAQERLGPAIHPYRNQIYLACKTTERDKEGSKKELLSSLKELQTDHFDVYQMHSMTTQEDVDKAFSSDGIIETLIWAKREGLIREIGFSTHNEDIALQIMDMFDFATVLFPMNWAMGLNIGWGDRIADKVKEKGMGLLAMKTLVERKWIDGDEKKLYPKSWCKPIFGDDKLAAAAIKYAFGKGAATTVPPGNFQHFEHLVKHIDAILEAPLTKEELEYLKTAASSEETKQNPIFDIK
ncbi:MAG: aldo/keto reductase [Clostridiales bacterium]|nr:aldo/keto reductase [Clostridiales bacterium]